MHTKFIVHRSSKTTQSISDALESLQHTSKSATRKVLLEIKQIYNSFNLRAIAADRKVRATDQLKAEIYSRYYPYFQRGLY